MRSVRLFDYLQYDTNSWQVVAQDGTTLALKNLTTGRIRKVAVADLLGDDSYVHDSPERLPNLDTAAILETLTRKPSGAPSSCTGTSSRCSPVCRPRPATTMSNRAPSTVPTTC